MDQTRRKCTRKAPAVDGSGATPSSLHARTQQDRAVTAKQSVSPQEESRRDARDIEASLQLYVKIPFVLGPIALFTVGIFLSIVPALLSSHEDHRRWGIEWYMASEDYWLLSVGAGLVLSGILLGRRRTVQETGYRVPVAGLTSATRILFLLMLAGYAAWAASGILNGLSLSLLWSALRGDPGAAPAVKDATETIPGVTTLTELGPPLVAALAILGMAGDRTRMRIMLIVLLSGLRAFANSERLSLLTVLLPLVIVWSSCRVEGGSRRSALPWAMARRRRIATLLAALSPLGMVLFFAVTERGRSWNSYYSDNFKGGNLIDFSYDRITAYYATATNNGVIYREFHEPYLKLPTQALDFVINMPILENILGSYGLLAGPSWMQTLSAYSNPEFNNPGTIIPIYADLGIVFASMFFVVAGFVVARLARSGQAANVAALCAYSSLAIALPELGRFSYLTLGRALVTILGCYVIYRATSGRRARTSPT